MISRFKSYVKESLHRLGLDVRYAVKHDALAMQTELLKRIDVCTVVDGGAYQGEWSGNYRRSFPQADIYMFEPFPSSQEILRSAFADDSKAHLVAQALGERRERRVLHTNKLSATNSLLPVDRSVQAKLPDPEWVTPEGELSVEVTDLDSFCGERAIAHVNVLKLDIQGNELAALHGAAGLLKRHAIDLIYSELLFLPHYEGQAFHFQICDYLHRCGYQLFGLYNLGVLNSGQMLQADGIFIAPRLQA